VSSVKEIAMHRHAPRVHRLLLAVLLCVCYVGAGAEESAGLPVSGSYKWGGKSGTLTGTITETATTGAYQIRLVAKWKGKDKAGYDGTVSIDDKGNVTGSIRHAKQGTYTLSGTFANDALTCQYQGKKSKKDNPVTIDIQRPDKDGA
jgi:hypothetical protein